ncbi:MAG: cupin domain-containing protein [Candidatus Acidiferrales bacterium]
MKPTTNGRGDVRDFFLCGNSRGSVLRATALVGMILCVAASASSDSPREAIIHPLQNANFVSATEPACLSTAVEAGNPATGPSAVLVKMEKGCMDAWHFHTAAEELIVIKGELKVETFSVPPAILGPGGYAQIPSNEKHQFTCGAKSECLAFVRIDRAYDSKAVQAPN